jgi:hypothetical protein
MLEKIKGNPNSALSGSVLVDDDGVPRFWGLIWAIYQPVGAASTLEKKLRYIESLYKHCQEIADPSLLDSAITSLDVEQLSSLLQAYYIHLSNPGPLQAPWQAKAITSIPGIVSCPLLLSADSISLPFELNYNQKIVCFHHLV